MPSDLPADPVRSLALLWGPQDRQSRSGVSVGSIVSAAVAVADAEGLGAVSMRRVSDAIGAGTMTLYTHVPGKAELLELMTDTVVGGIYSGLDHFAGRDDWRASMSEIARRNWDLHLAHPWLAQMAQVTGGRPVLGPRLSDKYETELRALDGIGLTDLEMDSVLALVLIHVEGTARAHLAQRRAESSSGESDAQWWERAAPILGTLMDGSRYPVSGRVGAAAGQEYQAASAPDRLLAFGLDRILDGVGLLVAGRS